MPSIEARERRVPFTEGGTRYVIVLHDHDQVTRDTADCEFGVYDEDWPNNCNYAGSFEGSGHPDGFSDARLIEIAREELAEGL
jgi:hypothetical protein